MEGSCWVNIYIFFNRFFKSQRHKMVEHTQTIRWQYFEAEFFSRKDILVQSK